ncbi:MAG TPA: ornithine cyclodeaminase family protein [Longimicrobiales bacterium]
MTVQVPMIDAPAIAAALPMPTCIELMADALRALDDGTVAQPIRSVVHLPDGAGSLYTMPAFISSPPALAVKLISVFERNAERSQPTHQGLIVVFDPDTGTPALLLDAAAVTAIRTAAVSAVATRELALPGADVLAIVGTGVQARSHITAIALVRPIREIRIWGRNAGHARRLADEVHDAAAAVTVCATAAEAAAGAGIICTVTSARKPVLRGEWVAPGTHVNAIGASLPTAREVDSALAADARVFVDSIDAALTEPGDLLIPLREGVTNSNHWLPLGAVLNGHARGRRTAAEITLFKSVGLAIEDAAAAAHIARRIISTPEE